MKPSPRPREGFRSLRQCRKSLGASRRKSVLWFNRSGFDVGSGGWSTQRVPCEANANEPLGAWVGQSAGRTISIEVSGLIADIAAEGGQAVLQGHVSVGLVKRAVGVCGSASRESCQRSRPSLAACPSDIA